MNIEDIFNRIIQKSGQYLLSTNNIEINIDAFRILVEDALSIYNKVSPFDKTFTVDLSGRQVNFSDDDSYFSEVGRVPDWIAKATPILNYSTGANPNFLAPAFSHNNHHPSEPIESIHKYHKPCLVVNISGNWEVIGVWNHRVELIPKVGAGKREYEVKTISVEDHLFFDLLKAMFLQGVGYSRRAFTMDALPLATDADSMVADADNQLSTAKDELNNIQKFYLGV
ncbi:MAG: hypothetical protein HRU18_01540 [Pseudoalteromonas sp.]|uniref:hypothetical protein n=1 Tax=Pseudoalteromonas sp. TaxID=53249 RepID=UPI001DD008C7|nr:hypothetical protein [Pseudoalteromonas sp.]NRA76864.1 hypothetical protein [Pseudoalteromonas sp.]